MNAAAEIGRNPASTRCNVNKLSCNPSFPCILCFCDILAWQLMILYSILVDFSPTFFTQAPIHILVWLDGTIIHIISTILVTMYYSGYVGL